ncbi:MAG: penicillin-binding protein 2 [Desulfobacterales bacterium]|nr:penicillin-binding protein 2 [Desulfobacterales bacterium]MDJ0989950.1 penicillin-binding protein 2 [Desulfobacterales bacterium]
MSRYLKSVDSEWFRQRLIMLMIAVLLAVLVLVLRLFYLQIIQGQEFRRLSLNNSIRLQNIDAPRGFIYDRHGTLLVDNRPSFDLYVNLKDARPLDQTLKRLSPHTGIALENLVQRVETELRASALKPILIERDIGRDALATIESHRYDLPGIDVQVRRLRNYIFPNFAAHLLGYIGEVNPDELKRSVNADLRMGDQIGKFGVEKSLERYLRGERGGRQVEVNANGQVVRVLHTVYARSGHSIYLTIDRDLQKKAEEMLTGEAGAVVAVDPQNGEILALASGPAFDQNDFITGLSTEKWRALIENPDRPLNNKAIQGEYPPASTYKIIASLAGLQEGVITPDETIFCPGYHRFGNRTYRCWRRGGHGWVDLNQAIARSCDVYFYQVGQRLGIDRLAFYANASGLGKRTGIALDHESRGLVPTAAWKKKRTGIAWQAGETLSVAIGQGFNLTTPLQMAMFTAAVANDGNRYQPVLVKNIVKPGGAPAVARPPKRVGRLPVDAAHLAEVKRGMWEVVQGEKGTARIARLKQIEICGKTGTAQVVSLDKFEKDAASKDERRFKDHAWFIAYAPTDAPRIAIAVIVEHGEHGSSAAAPIARELVRTYLGPPSEAPMSARSAEPVPAAPAGGGNG